MGEPFPPTTLRRRQAQTVGDSSSSYNIDYVIVIKNFLNPVGHQNPISGSKVTTKGWGEKMPKSPLAAAATTGSGGGRRKK